MGDFQETWTFMFLYAVIITKDFQIKYLNQF